MLFRSHWPHVFNACRNGFVCLIESEEDVNRRVETFVFTRCVYKFGRPQFVKKNGRGEDRRKIARRWRSGPRR